MSTARSPHEEPATLRPPAQAPISDAYRSYVLGLLVVVYIVNFLDRQILVILAESIRKDLGLSDTTLGLMGGTAFAIFYTFAGIPIARLADRSVRRTVIAVSLFAWSTMTAVTGLAQNAGQLVLARIGVGIGEAGCSPPAHSLLADYFPPNRRGMALSIYAAGIPIGAAIGYMLGGWLNEAFSWRVAFFVAGVPGIALTFIVYFTLRELPRGSSEPTAALRALAASTPQPSTGATLSFMLRLRSCRHMAIAAALHAFFGYGAGAFLAPFMIRAHGFGTTELGLVLGLIALVFGTAGTAGAGLISDWLSGRDQRWYMWVPAYSTLASVPFLVLVYLWPSGYGALAWDVPRVVAAAMYLGPTAAMVQTLVRPEMRSLAAAILLFIINLVGLGLGPLAIGFVSDQLKPALGPVDSLRYSLLFVVCGTALWSALHYLLAARTLQADMQAKHLPLAATV
jgi:MFS family permease